MARKKLSPTDPKVTARILKRIETMSPDELMAFIQYRTPGVPMTDMRGIFKDCPTPELPADAKQHPANE